MRIYTWTNGFFLQRDANDDLIAIGPAVAQFGVPDADVFLRYQLLPDPEPGDLPEVRILDVDPYFINVATGASAGTAQWLPVPSDAEIRIGRFTFSETGTWHDLMEFELPGLNASFLFQLDGEALPDFATLTPDQLMALGPVAGPSPDFLPGDVFAFDDAPAQSYNLVTTPRIIRSGNVVEDRTNGWHEIGTYRGMDGAGDGSVTVLGGAFWALPTDTNFNQIYVGGWGAHGAVTVIGTGSEAVWQAGNDPDTRLDAQIGVDGGTGRIDILDGAYWEVADAINSPGSRGDLSFGIMDGRAEVRIDDSRFEYFGFDTAYLTLGNGTITLSTDTDARMSARDAARIYIGAENYGDEIGILEISGGSRLLADRLDEFFIGTRGGTGFVTVDSAVLSGSTGPEADATMWVQVGGDGGTGTLDVRNNGDIDFSNPHPQTRESTSFLMEVGKGVGLIWDDTTGGQVDRGGDGMLMADQNGRISIDGYGTTRIEVGTEGGNGAVRLISGGSLTVSGSDSTDLVIGNGTGHGSVILSSNATMDLGGGARIQVGGVLPPDIPGWADGTLELWGPNATVTGFATLQAGTPFDQIDQMHTPRGYASVTVGNGSILGNAGATLNFGVMSELNLWGHGGSVATIVGDVNLGGTWVTMGEMGGANAVIDGNLTVAESFSMLRMSISEDWETGEAEVDRLHVTGDFNLAGGELKMMFEPSWGYEFSAGETHALISFGRLVDGDAAFDVTLGHHIFMPDLAWMFWIDRVEDGALSFRALTDMDGTGDAVLDFRLGDTALTMAHDPLAGDITFMGGGLYGGIAQNIEVIYGTGFDDVIDLGGHARSLQIYGGAGDDVITGGAADDWLMGGAGNDRIDGGGGVNTAVFTGARGDYEVVIESEGEGEGETVTVTVTDLRDGSPDGTDTLVNIQRLHFLGDGSTEPIAPPSVSLAGLVRGRDDSALEGTTVTFTPLEGDSTSMTTGGDRLFLLDDIAHGASGHLWAARDFTTGDPGLSISSAINAIRLALGLGMPGQAQVTAHDWIAADFTGDGVVNLTDGIEILKGALGLTAEGPRWVFLDAGADLSAVDRSNVVYDSGIDLAVLEADVGGLVLTGILVGHVQEYVTG